MLTLFSGCFMKFSEEKGILTHSQPPGPQAFASEQEPAALEGAAHSVFSDDAFMYFTYSKYVSAEILTTRPIQKMAFLLFVFRNSFSEGAQSQEFPVLQLNFGIT